MIKMRVIPRILNPDVHVFSTVLNEEPEYAMVGSEETNPAKSLRFDKYLMRQQNGKTTDPKPVAFPYTPQQSFIKAHLNGHVMLV